MSVEQKYYEMVAEYKEALEECKAYELQIKIMMALGMPYDKEFMDKQDEKLRKKEEKIHKDPGYQAFIKTGKYTKEDMDATARYWGLK